MRSRSSCGASVATCSGPAPFQPDLPRVNSKLGILGMMLLGMMIWEETNSDRAKGLNCSRGSLLLPVVVDAIHSPSISLSWPEGWVALSCSAKVRSNPPFTYKRQNRATSKMSACESRVFLHLFHRAEGKKTQIKLNSDTRRTQRQWLALENMSTHAMSING